VLYGAVLSCACAVLCCARAALCCPVQDLELEVAREQAAYEAQQAWPRHVVVRQQGNAGHLKHVQVVNFMCHHNFAMDFG
jgi:hypothetical protein